MKSTTTLLLTMFAGFVIMGCKSKSQKNNDTVDLKEMAKKYPGINKGAGTYDISAPEGWDKKDTTMSGVKFTAIISPPDGANDIFRENINVVTENAKDLNLDEYEKANRLTMKGQMTGMNIIKDGETVIGNMPAKWIFYSFDYSGYPLKNTVYFLVKNRIGYTITCSALSSDFDKFQAAFKTSVNSFTINE
ncbi:MAG TPA: hypothetical protein PKJ94_10075 [Ferruginibacter sp.]|nr:hypothetical protein [Ferruginibacter sp.]